MRSGALSFLAGIMLLQQFAELPSYYWCIPVIPLLVLLLWHKQFVHWLAFCFAAGFSWALIHAQTSIQQRLAANLVSKDVLISGRITGIPKQYLRHTRFEFVVEDLQYKGKQYTSTKHIQLNWYGKQVSGLTPGDYWQLQVRLKPPYGTFNPGGFDYEQYLFEKGTDAKGYVRKNKHNQIIPAKHNHFDLDRLRQSIYQQLKILIGDNGNAPLIYALAIGERSDMSATQWRVLRDTGTAHLMAISGLHIGLVAAIGFWLGRWGWSFCGRGPLIISAHKVGAVIAIGMALVYAFLAGWSIPTQRAFIMVMIVMSGLFFYRNLVTSRVLAFALFAVLFYDPISVLSAGFWLSFAAVSIIAYAVSGLKRSTGKLKQWGYVQWSISIGLLPLMLLLFQQVSLIAPVANLWAIPVVSMLVVPLVLLAILSLFISEFIANILLQAAVTVIDGTWWLLELMLQWPWSVWYAATPAWWAIIIAVLGVILLLTPKGFPAKNLSLVFFLPLFFPSTQRIHDGEINFHLLDVGQGLAAVIQTREHVLVFDTGPKFSERFDSGERIVLPYLRQQGVTHLDVLMVSHEDNDHIGGANAILEQMPVDRILTSRPEKINNIHKTENCLSGQSWVWNAVKFEVLHPDDDFMHKDSKRRHRNNRSCVIRISSNDHSILLTADIEKRAERRLLEKYAEKLNSDILVIPHHGSRTSSSAGFLEAVSPGWALLPVGYLNRYRLPSKQVMQRYKERNIEVLSTALEGAISFKLMKNQPATISRYRRQAQRYWHYPRD